MSYSIYISSTYRDLITERKVLRTLLDQAQFSTVCMEKYPPAFTGDIKTKCEEDVQNADLYVCIVGDSYGSIAKDENGGELEYSYTEFEYDTAVAGHKPRLIFFKKESLIEDEKLIAFMAKIHKSPLGYAEFSHIHELPAMVLASIISETGGYKKKIIPATIKYLCNRSEQAQTFTSSLIRNQNKQIHFFLVSGHRRNGHAVLVNRFIYTLKNMFNGQETLDIIVLAQCFPATGEERVLTYIKQKVIAQLEVKTNQFGLDFSASSFFACLEKMKANCLLIRIVIQSTSLMQNNEIYKKCMQRFCSGFSLNEYPGFTNKRIIFFIHIQHEGVSVNEREVVLKFGSEDCFVDMQLPELTKIGEGDITEWLMQNNIEDNDTTISDLYTDYFSDIKKDDDNLFFMDDVAIRLQKVIDFYNKSKY